MSQSFETLDPTELTRVCGAFAAQLTAAMQRARELGLQITSTTGGQHAKDSLHYAGRAIDFAGSVYAMRELYRELSQTNPAELFYDPMGGIKDGHNIGAIGGHRDHVHVAY